MAMMPATTIAIAAITARATATVLKQSLNDPQLWANAGCGRQTTRTAASTVTAAARRHAAASLLTGGRLRPRPARPPALHVPGR
jgi:hypothetical protein